LTLISWDNSILCNEIDKLEDKNNGGKENDEEDASWWIQNDIYYHQTTKIRQFWKKEFTYFSLFIEKANFYIVDFLLILLKLLIQYFF